MSEYTFKLPDLGEGTVESEIAEWHIKVGDTVAEEDVVGTMMTDKAAVELSSPVSGKVLKLAGEPGDTVNVGAPLVIFETGTDDVSAAVPEIKIGPETGDGQDGVTTPSEDAGAATAQSVHHDARPDDHIEAGRVATSPAIRRRAREANIDLKQIQGSGSHGRILRKDLDAYLQQQLPKPVPGSPSAERGTTEIKIIGVRRMIAERLSQAKREIPHFSYVEETDITELESLRKSLNAERDSSDRLTLLPFLGLALIRAVEEFPQCNTTHDREKDVLIRHKSVHLGIATQTSSGLKVPVVKHANERGLDGLAAEMRRVADAARNNRIKRDELSGSTITLTSLGKLGGIVTTPVVNQPEVAIIGVNRAVERPMVIDGQIAIRLMMNLSSSFDHRFVDGYDAAAMIQLIKNMLEHPARLFMRA